MFHDMTIEKVGMTGCVALHVKISSWLHLRIAPP